MAKTYHVCSTLASSQLYTQWIAQGENGELLPLKGRQIHIKGGTGVAAENAGHIWTPLGVKTEISEDEYKVLQGIDQFKTHIKAGFVMVLEKDVPAEKVASDMSLSDPSSPKTPSSADFSNKEPGGA